MTGRLRKDYVFKTIKINPKATGKELFHYDVVVARARAKNLARIDCVGKIERTSNLSFIKLDLKK